MRHTLVLTAVLLAAGCGTADPSAGSNSSAATNAAAGVAQARVELAQLDVERCEGDFKDAQEDVSRLVGSSTPTKTMVDARRKVGDAEHHLKVARVKLKEQQAFLEYAKATGRLQ